MCSRIARFELVTVKRAVFRTGSADKGILRDFNSRIGVKGRAGIRERTEKHLHFLIVSGAEQTETVPRGKKAQLQEWYLENTHRTRS